MTRDPANDQTQALDFALPPSLSVITTRQSSQWPVAAVLDVAWMQSFGIGLLVAFVVSIGEGLIAQSWLRGVIPAVLLAIGGVHISMGSVQPFY